MGDIARALLRPTTYVGHAREAVSLARAVATYPLGLFGAALATTEPSGDRRHDTPVVLVHGFGHNRSGWFVLDRRLRQAGFTCVQMVNYNPLRNDIAELCDQLADRIELIRTISEAPRVHVIGHSLGGILLRWYVQELGGDEVVDTAVTIATPHRGTRTAVAGVMWTAVGRQLLPGSNLMRKLHQGARASSVRWISYYSNLDMLVSPASSAKLTEPALAATNVLVKDEGHLSLMVSPALASSVVAQLEAAEGEGATITSLAGRVATTSPHTAAKAKAAPSDTGRAARSAGRVS